MSKKEDRVIKKIDKTYAFEYVFKQSLVLNETEVKDMGLDVEAFKHWLDKTMELSPVENENTKYPNSYNCHYEMVHPDGIWDSFDESWVEHFKDFVKEEFPSGIIPKHYSLDEIDRNSKAFERFK
ncbi:hypothetical protein N8748_01135 [bacterium]|nr:hypothetical protein [bacterium]